MLRTLLFAEYPAAPRRVLWPDVALTALVGAAGVVLAFTVTDDGDRLDAVGWLLLAGCVLPVAWRRRWPMAVLVVAVGTAGVYHALDYNHAAPVPASIAAIYTVAAVGPRRRTVLTGGLVILVVLAVWARAGDQPGAETLRVSGWLLAVVAFGEAVRIHREYLAATTERAERAERTREEEAARRVAEERLRIARDLHDLLAHSITLIGVQTSVASHVLLADPERLDRRTLARALDGIVPAVRPVPSAVAAARPSCPAA